MSYLPTAKTLILISIISLLLGGCSGGSSAEGSEHGLVSTPTTETNVAGTDTDVNVTVQAKVGATLSIAVRLNIYWEVNGHRLPPEPDSAVEMGSGDNDNLI